MSLSEAKQILKNFGITISKTPWHEYRVAPGSKFQMLRQETEECAYYSPDLEDAIATGKLMAAELERKRS